MNNAIFQSNDYLSNESLFQIQSDVIRKVAAEQSCILVGRCADYILRDNENCISVFISARMEDRIRRAVEYAHIEEKEAEEYIRKADKSRASYYNYYTDKIWGATESFVLFNPPVLNFFNCQPNINPVVIEAIKSATGILPQTPSVPQ